MASHAVPGVASQAALRATLTGEMGHLQPGT